MKIHCKETPKVYQKIKSCHLATVAMYLAMDCNAKDHKLLQRVNIHSYNNSKGKRLFL